MMEEKMMEEEGTLERGGGIMERTKVQTGSQV
jgi:hypothetical protein